MHATGLWSSSLLLLLLLLQFGGMAQLAGSWCRACDLALLSKPVVVSTPLHLLTHITLPPSLSPLTRTRTHNTGTRTHDTRTHELLSLLGMRLTDWRNSLSILFCRFAPARYACLDAGGAAVGLSPSCHVFAPSAVWTRRRWQFPATCDDPPPRGGHSLASERRRRRRRRCCTKRRTPVPAACTRFPAYGAG